MPGSKFTKQVNTPKKARTWEAVYSSAKSRGAAPGSAIRQANASVKKGKK